MSQRTTNTTRCFLSSLRSPHGFIVSTSVLMTPELNKLVKGCREATLLARSQKEKYVLEGGFKENAEIHGKHFFGPLKVQCVIFEEFEKKQ